MHCSQIEKLSKYYVNGDLDNEHSYIIRNHLTRCVSCKLRVRWLSISKIIPKIFLVIAIIGIATFLIVRSTSQRKAVFGAAEKKVVSNIIIELFSRDSEGDSELVKDFTNKFGGKVVEKNPLSIKLRKDRVNEFIERLDKILVLPDGTPRRVEEFISPLKESDIVIVKIKFLEKEV